MTEKFDYKTYWNDRYCGKIGRDHTSGAGSRGQLATWKGEVISDIIKEYHITSVLDYGSGDGWQLKFIDGVRDYMGVDVSEKAVEMCRKQFPQHSFMTWRDFNEMPVPVKKDMVMCIDVLYHIVDDQEYYQALRDILRSAERYVLLYVPPDGFQLKVEQHIKYRNFVDDLIHIENNCKMIKRVDQKYPAAVCGTKHGSYCNFYLFEKS